MTEILIQNSTFIIIIVVLVVCIVIGFLGDMYMRKKGKLGSLIKKKEKNSDKKLEVSDRNETSAEESSIKQETNNYDPEGLIDFDSQNMFQDLTNNSQAQDVIEVQGNNIASNQTPIQNFSINQGMQTFQNPELLQNQNNGNIIPTQDEFTRTLIYGNSDNNSNSTNVVNNPPANPVPFDGNLQNDDQINNMF